MSFNPEHHDKQVAESYKKLFMYDAFDRLIDMALDGQITREEAIAAYQLDLSPAETTAGKATPDG